MKRSGRLNPKSKKTAKEDRELAPIRRAFVEEMGRCAVLPEYAASAVHEIHGGSDRHITRKERCFWLAVSEPGHRKVQYWSKARQLALKLLVDGDNLDLKRFNEVYVRGGKEGRITKSMIAQHLQLKEE
jgi:hypothetical protein